MCAFHWTLTLHVIDVMKYFVLVGLSQIIDNRLSVRTFTVLSFGAVAPVPVPSILNISIFAILNITPFMIDRYNPSRYSVFHIFPLLVIIELI